MQYFVYPNWKFDRLRKDFPDGRDEADAGIDKDEWMELQLEMESTRAVAMNNFNKRKKAQAAPTGTASAVKFP